MVDERLRLPDHPDVFVIGDLTASTLDNGSPVPQVAAAVRGGRHAAGLIEATERRVTIDPFPDKDRGSLADIGRNAAVVELPSGLRMSGFLGWVAWLALHLVMLVGPRNRANELVNWAWNYLTYDRGSRLVVEQDAPLPEINPPR